MEISLLKDLYRYEGKQCHSLKVQIKYILFIPGFTITYLFRKASASRNVIFKLWWSMMHRIGVVVTGIQIPVGTQIGEGFRILHFGTIVVNPAVCIGRNFTIAQGCLLGNAQGKRCGVPVIGDNVQMSANSVVIGGGENRK